MKIGELAALAKCQTVTIRYYEKIGLLSGAGRDGLNHRVYDREAAERLRFILHCRNHGIPIADIKSLLDLRDDAGKKGSGVVNILRKHITNLKNRRDSLDHLINGLIALLACAGEENEILAVLGGPCPHCPDYGASLGNGLKPDKRAACLVDPALRKNREVF